MPYYNRHVKIIATIGPSCEDPDILLKMIEAGVDVLRFNFSHASYDELDRVFEQIEKIKRETGRRLAVMADLQGPKIRVGLLEKSPINLEPGQEVYLIVAEKSSNPNEIPIVYPHLGKDVKPGEEILFDDGRIKVQVTEVVSNERVKAKVIYGGNLYPKKGVNFPHTDLSVPALTEKDLRDIEYILQKPFHWVALSFVREAKEVRRLREILAEGRPEHPPRIIAKIEKPQAVENIDEIIEEADAIMIARGDLGVELPVEELPIIQKRIITKCIKRSKPVIVATQIFEHMINNPMPTRAEVNDVANLIYDGADALMLSAETSIGKYPVLVIETISKIIEEVEKEAEEIYLPIVGTNKWGSCPQKDSPTFLSDVVCYHACKMAVETDAKAILSMTYSGYTAFQMSSYRPKPPIYVFTANKFLLDALNLVWGVRVFHYNKFESTDQTIHDVQNILKNLKLVKPTDVVINTASMPIQARGRTNMVKISVIE